MTIDEALSRLRAGDLSEEEATAWRARIADDPAVAARWSALDALDGDLGALLAAPPPGLNARILQRHARARRPWGWAAIALAAGLLLGLGLGPLREAPVVGLELDDGLRVVGRARLAAGGARVDIDGDASVRSPPLAVEVRGGRAVVRTPTGTTTLGPGDRFGLAAPEPPPSAPPLHDQPGTDPRIAELELKVRLLEEMLQAQVVEYEGSAIPWPDDLPEDFEPDGFRRNLRLAVEECAPDVELVGFDCSEPPCLAQLRASDSDWWDRLVNRCPHFTDHYGNAVASASGRAVCADGSTESMQLLGWSWSAVEETHPLDDEARINFGKRFQARIEENQRAWPCKTDEVP